MYTVFGKAGWLMLQNLPSILITSQEKKPGITASNPTVKTSSKTAVAKAKKKVKLESF